MENASKALIIAGAILLAIVIISLGLIVVNNSRSAVDSANMSEQEIQTFNAKLLPYEGAIKGTRVKMLMQTINAINNAEGQKKDRITLNSPFSGVTDTINVTNGTTYTVSFSYDDKGMINVVNIE